RVPVGGEPVEELDVTDPIRTQARTELGHSDGVRPMLDVELLPRKRHRRPASRHDPAFHTATRSSNGAGLSRSLLVRATLWRPRQWEAATRRRSSPSASSFGRLNTGQGP